LNDTGHLEQSLREIAQAKRDFVKHLQGAGYHPLPSATHFFLLQVGDAATCRQTLLQRGLLIRDCTSFGLPTYIRIATRRPQENRRLLQALETLR
jgi:histidinol-phosphate/aromatic aminotransferase/cobyric acid decarboxylase-like protein